MKRNRSPYFTFCSRCGSRAYEVLESYGYCIECQFSEDVDAPYEYAVPKWALEHKAEVQPMRHVLNENGAEFNGAAS